MASNQPAGNESFTVTVSDTSTPPLTAAQTFAVDVFSSTVLPPVLNPIPKQSATVGTTFSLDVSKFASDPNTPALNSLI